MKTLRTALLAVLCVALAPLSTSFLAAAADAGGLHTVAAALEDAGSAHAAFIRRGKIKKRQTVGYKVVVVVGDDEETNEVDTVDVHLAPTGETEGGESSFTLPLKVVKENGNKRFVFNCLCDAQFDIGASYTMTSTMKDANNNQVGEPKVQEIAVQDDGPAQLRSVDIVQTDATNFDVRVLVVGDLEQEVATVEVEITDLIGNPAQPDTVVITEPGRNGSKAWFIMQTLTFDDPDSAADEIYGVVVTLRNNDGVSLGSSDYEVVVEGMEVVDATWGFCWDGVQNGQETGVDCGGPYCNACPTIDDSIDLLSELAVDGMAEAGDALGLDVDLASASFVRAPGGGIIWTANAGNSGILFRADHNGSPTLGSLPVQYIGLFTTNHMEVIANDDGSVTSVLSTYDENFELVFVQEETTFPCESADLREPLHDLVAGTTATGVQVGTTAKYGDIILMQAAHFTGFND